MKHTKIFRTHILVLFALLFLVVPATFGQDRIAREALYNSPDGFHIPIPQDWENQSTEEYAHFINPEAGVDIYAASAQTADMEAGIREVMSLILPEFAGEPLQVSEVILSNGTWTQSIYAAGDEARMTAYGQVYEGTTYVVVWHNARSQTDAQPLIVPGEDVQPGITAALETLGETPGEPVSTEEIDFNEEAWTLNTYDSTPPVPEAFSVLGRVRGENTLVIANITSGSYTPLPVFFSLLTGFFITPATTPYLYLGLAAAAVIAVAFIGTLLVRYRNLRKDMETLATLEGEG
jgi:hypothetical protein